MGIMSCVGALRPFLMLGMCCLVFSACTKAARQASGLPATERQHVSRVVIPAKGGQTIRTPRLMGDAIQLWSPLNAGEKRKAEARFNLAATQREYEFACWLPASERVTMLDYLYRLENEQKSLRKRVQDRVTIHLPIIMEGVKAQGLPAELACLPLVESAFEPQAISSAGAAGIWQLMPGTAREFGLTVTDSVDERFDVQKSTRAATAYLAYLYNFFGDWPLAIAAYNCGEGTMKKALARSGCTTLDGLTAFCRQSQDETGPLKEETLRFVPKLIAAIAIMQRSDSWGAAPRLADLSAARSRHMPEKSGDRLALTGQYGAIEQPHKAPPRSTRLP